MSKADGLHPLHKQQMPAVHPEEVVWLSASAGTGKTQVLSARVLRLLLQPHVEPSQILCLTFTKAGATEMAERINDTLARWVRLDDLKLAADLKAIGADFGEAALARARTLFAAVLDCPGGGLRINTIHAFAQWLLGAFPEEAGLLPGVRAMEDRDKELLLREVLGGLLSEAEARGDTGLLGAAEDLSIRYGPDKVPAFLLRCAEAREAFVEPGHWQPPMAARVRQLIGLRSDASEADLPALCGDDVFDVAALKSCLATLAAWDSKTGRDATTAIGNWLVASPEGRLEQIGELYAGLFNKGNGLPIQLTNLLKRDPGYGEQIERVGASIAAVRERKAMLDLAGWLAPALELGYAFTTAWDAAKAREGFIDFNDQIRAAARLLTRSDLSEWIRYKLDRQIDHVLVDEAQDTNAAQWSIIKALSEEYFAGEGARGDVLRTLFVVGDYKQAIFGFQGTSPENFSHAKAWFAEKMRSAADNLAGQRSNRRVRTLQDLGLDQSFRTATSILEFVDRAVEAIGYQAFGLDQAPAPHVGQERPGQVTLWGVIGDQSADAEEADESADEGEEGWLGEAERTLADKIARQVRDWIDPKGSGFPLVKVKDKPRRAHAGDVMVLVRKRGALAALVVARLHAHGVPVAGVDRLRLGAPLAVRDLMAALRFAAQPYDDLNLACLLGSPLVGWSQEQLLEHCWREKDVALWDHLRRLRHPDVARALDQLGELLRRADFEPVQALLHWLLAGPWQARSALVARLGREANDPIDELLNAASAYASGNVPSLQGFIHWFDAGTGDLKREAGRSDRLVRVMTVHGSKGLQAPIVILADAAGDPPSAQKNGIELDDRGDVGAAAEERPPRRIPLPPLSKELHVGPIKAAVEAAQVAEMQEHWRLMYVAMTRAEEALFVTGALNSRQKKVPEDSWYGRLAALVPEDQWLEDLRWTRRAVHGARPAVIVPADRAEAPTRPELPAWTRAMAPAEARPPRPLAPSSLGEDLASDPPYPPGAGREAARRGTLLHSLLERLPMVDAAQREALGARWLARNAADLTEAERAGLLAGALAVIAHPDWAELFGAQALAEVPIAATVGPRVVAGTIDRLLVTPERILLVDFKTARRPPAGLDEVPTGIVRQMAAYVAALEAAYPGRAVQAALLYTQVPMLLALPGALIDEHKQALRAAQ